MLLTDLLLLSLLSFRTQLHQPRGGRAHINHQSQKMCPTSLPTGQSGRGPFSIGGFFFPSDWPLSSLHKASQPKARAQGGLPSLLPHEFQDPAQLSGSEGVPWPAAPFHWSPENPYKPGFLFESGSYYVALAVLELAM